MAISKRNCATGFEAAGIEPYNPSKALASRFIVTQDEQRPTTPTTPGYNQTEELWDLTMTPTSHQHISTALQYLSGSTELDRTVRTVFAKTGKALERSQFDLATAQREIKLMRRKIGDISKKHKRKQSVNPNKLFVGLADVEMGSVGPPVPMAPATATQVNPERVPIAHVAASRPLDPFGAVTTALQAIRYS